MRLIFYLYLFFSLVNAGIYDQTESKMDKGIEELDDDITLEKKSLMILTADADNDQEIAERVLSIISTQATSIGRFEVIDRNLVDQILEEQKFQPLSKTNEKPLFSFFETLWFGRIVFDLGKNGSAFFAWVLRKTRF